MKSFTILFLAMGLSVLSSCGDSSKKEDKGTASQDTAFRKHCDQFIEALWKQYPGWATSVGYHKYDSVLVIPDGAARESEKQFLLSQQKALEAFDPKNLSELNRMDYYLIRNFIESGLWGMNEFKGFEWDPSSYNVADGFAQLVNETYAPLSDRLSSALIRMKNIPEYYAAAKANLNRPAKPHTELAIRQNKGTIDFLKTTMADSVKKSTLTESQKKEFEALLAQAETAVNDYIAFLENLVKTEKEGTFRDFRIGKEQFNKKFSFDIQSKFTADEIFQVAQTRKKEIQAEMIRLSKELWPVIFKGEQVPAEFTLKDVRKMIDQLSLRHSSPENFVADVKKQIPDLTQFVNDKNLLYLDPSKPLVVRETPLYMRGFAGASINSPGPYDKQGNTYYNVTPLDDNTPDQAESWLREYNHYLMQILNIHEAIPGHYAQLVYSNQSPSLIKSILGNGAMIEGWAVYTERMMLEEGYGAGDETEKKALWLMYYKWHLRSVMNTILDYSIHCLNLSEEEAMRLMTEEAFQQEAEARGKWRRATLSQVQLCSYFTGYTEIAALKSELKEKSGFDLKKFHEQFLSYGSSPVKYIREAMLEGKQK